MEKDFSYPTMCVLWNSARCCKNCFFYGDKRFWSTSSSRILICLNQNCLESVQNITSIMPTTDFLYYSEISDLNINGAKRNLSIYQGVYLRGVFSNRGFTVYSPSDGASLPGTISDKSVLQSEIRIQFIVVSAL